MRFFVYSNELLTCWGGNKRERERENEGDTLHFSIHGAIQFLQFARSCTWQGPTFALSCFFRNTAANNGAKPSTLEQTSPFLRALSGGANFLRVASLEASGKSDIYGRQVETVHHLWIANAGNISDATDVLGFSEGRETLEKSFDQTRAAVQCHPLISCDTPAENKESTELEEGKLKACTSEFNLLLFLTSAFFVFQFHELFFSMTSRNSFFYILCKSACVHVLVSWCKYSPKAQLASFEISITWITEIFLREA